jgi:hypothetical protein
VARVAARADGVGLARHPLSHDVVAGGVHIFVYQEHISGKPRASGARAALDYFQVPDAGNRVAEYAQRKQEMVVRLIEAGDFTAYPDALRFVIAVKDAGAAASRAIPARSSSRLTPPSAWHSRRSARPRN